MCTRQRMFSCELTSAQHTRTYGADKRDCCMRGSSKQFKPSARHVHKCASRALSCRAHNSRRVANNNHWLHLASIFAICDLRGRRWHAPVGARIALMSERARASRSRRQKCSSGRPAQQLATRARSSIWFGRARNQRSRTRTQNLHARVVLRCAEMIRTFRFLM